MKIHKHVWYSHRGVGKQVCAGCGLVLLRNKLTSIAVQYGCDRDEIPQYRKETALELERMRQAYADCRLP